MTSTAASAKDANNIRIQNFIGLPVTAPLIDYTGSDSAALYLMKVLSCRYKLKLSFNFDGQYYNLDISDNNNLMLDVLGTSSLSIAWAITNSVIRYIDKKSRYGTN